MNAPTWSTSERTLSSSIKQEKRMATRKIITALVIGYLCAIAWTVYADVVYHNNVPLDAFLFHGLFPLSLGLCAMLTALVYDRNLKDIGFGRSRPKYFLYAIGIAAIVTVVPFLINLALGVATVNAAPKFDEELIVSGIPVLLILGLGEEAMWRGLLYSNVSRLYDFRWTSIIIGLLWAIWHYPVIIHTKFVYGDRPLWFALMMLTVMTVAMSFVFNVLRSASRSIWPCVVLHAVVNYLSFVLIEPMEVGRSFAFKSDIGIVYIVAMAILALAAIRMQKKVATGESVVGQPVVADAVARATGRL